MSFVFIANKNNKNSKYIFIITIRNLFGISGQASLDSIVEYKYTSETDSIETSKTVYIHDRLNNETTTLYYIWDNMHSKWINHGKVVERKNDAGLILQVLRFRWDKVEQEWENGLWYWSGHQKNKYDDNGRLIESINYLDQNNIESSTYRKSIWDYDSRGREIFNINYSRLMTENSELKASSERHVTYNDEAMTREEIFKNRAANSDVIENSSKKVVKLDHAGNEVEYESYKWNTREDKWLARNKTIQSFNSSNDVVEIVNKAWDTLASKWVNQKKIEQLYNSAGEKILTSEFTWKNHEGWYLREAHKREKAAIDSTSFDLVETSYVKESPNSAFVPTFRNYRAFDQGDREVALENFRWNDKEQKWEYGRKHVTTFDDKNNVTVTLNYRDINKSRWALAWKNIEKHDDKNNVLFVKQVYYNTDIVTHVGNGKFYFYSKDLTASSFPATSPGIHFTLYPNPARDIVHVKGIEHLQVDILVYDINGVKVLETNGTGINKLNLTGFASGIYFVRVTNESKTNTKTILLK